MMGKLLAAIGLTVLLGACGSTPISQSSPTPGSPKTPAASPSAAASASPAVPAGFVTTPVTGGAAASTTVTDVRVGQHPGYDRFVIEFAGGVPSYTVTPQSSATFTLSPKGEPVTLQGTSGVVINIHSVTNWTAYSGPTAFQPGYPYLRQALQIENFEGYQQWALGIQGAACVRVSVLASPNRLVVDVTGV